MSPVSVVGVSHLTAPVEIRERFAFAPGEAEVALVGLRGRSDVREAVLLSTCNRTELYVCPAGNTSVQEAAERDCAGKIAGRRNHEREDVGDLVVAHGERNEYFLPLHDARKHTA